MSDNPWEAYTEAHQIWMRARDASQLAATNVDRARLNLTNANKEEQQAYEAMIAAGKAAGVPFRTELDF